MQASAIKIAINLITSSTQINYINFSKAGLWNNKHWLVGTCKWVNDDAEVARGIEQELNYFEVDKWSLSKL